MSYVVPASLISSAGFVCVSCDKMLSQPYLEMVSPNLANVPPLEFLNCPFFMLHKPNHFPVPFRDRLCFNVLVPCPPHALPMASSVI